MAQLSDFSGGPEAGWEAWRRRHTTVRAVADGIMADKHCVRNEGRGCGIELQEGARLAVTGFCGYICTLIVWDQPLDLSSALKHFNNIPRRLAVAMAQHQRLGADSPLQLVSVHLLQEILRFL